ncbi:MAG: methylenetetrahydrofolate reductase [NAD(P)H], partial [Rikenellaceae bacterium]
MRIIEVINNAIKDKKCRFAFELLPPLKGEDITSIFATVDNLKRYDPAYINITYHREDVKYVERADGLLERRIASKRPGTVAIAAALMARYSIEVVPHLICGGFSKYDTEDALIDLSFLGIDNVLALRGDNLKDEKIFRGVPDGHLHAIELVSQIISMNSGKYIDTEVEQTHPTNFCIGVAGYPEKHLESPNIDMDIAYLKQKVAAGADYIITQMFFDNTNFFRFVDRCRKEGIKVPIIPGIKPMSTKSQLAMLPQIFHVDIPQNLAVQIEKYKSNKDIRALGIEWAINQCQELKAAGVPVIHFYTMG